MSAMTIYTPTCDTCGETLGDFSDLTRAIAWLTRHVDDPAREAHRGRVVPRATYYTTDRPDRPAARG